MVLTVEVGGELVAALLLPVNAYTLKAWLDEISETDTVTVETLTDYQARFSG